MKKSTRALVGMVALDAAILVGAWWMLLQVRSGAWKTADPAEAGRTIGEAAGGAIGIVTALLLVAFVIHRRRGN